MSKRLLCQRNVKVSTKLFELDGRKWSDSKLTRVLTTFRFFRRIEVQYLFDGRLGAALFNEGVTRATAHFAVTVVNYIDKDSYAGGDNSV